MKIPYERDILKLPYSGYMGKKFSEEEMLTRCELRDRRGLWHEYASIIPLLTRKGYSPAMIDEATGMTGVEQNMVVVAAQVWSPLTYTLKSLRDCLHSVCFCCQAFQV